MKGGCIFHFFLKGKLVYAGATSAWSFSATTSVLNLFEIYCTSTEETLYSADIVSSSLPCPVTMLTICSGKWNVVNTIPQPLKKLLLFPNKILQHHLCLTLYILHLLDELTKYLHLQFQYC